MRDCISRTLFRARWSFHRFLLVFFFTGATPATADAEAELDPPPDGVVVVVVVEVVVVVVVVVEVVVAAACSLRFWMRSRALRQSC